jgi:anti-sigma regulatory factor (Ser/Thr protein kinase)
VLPRSGFAARDRTVQEVRTSAVVDLPHTPASVAVARRRLTDELTAAGIYDPAVGDAALVVSELLSNAIRHASPLPGENVQVAWAVGDGAIEVAVSDGGSATRPRPANASLSSLGGRGLDIVDYLSRRWGVRTDDNGLTVWAIVAAPPGGTETPEARSAGLSGEADA